MRKFLLGALLSLCTIAAFGQAQVMRCDPNATGSSQYPNVICDSSGHLVVVSSGAGGDTVVVGTAANGIAPAGNPVLIAGYDGSLTRILKTDNAGNLNVNGISVNGAADTTGNSALKVMGWDGTNQRTLKTDTLGQIAVVPGSGTLTDCSGSITVGGTVQSVTGTNATRRYLLIQNQSTGPEYINFTNNATIGSGSIEIAASGSFTMENGFVSTEAVSIIGATIAQAFTCKQR